MAKGRGGGKTPIKVIEFLEIAVGKSSIRAVARTIGLTQSAIHRYLKGIGEPSQETLERLADYFVVSVAELRGVEGVGKHNLEFEEYRKLREGIGSIIGDFRDRFKKAFNAAIISESDRDELQGIAFDAGFLLYSSEKFQMFFAEIVRGKEAWDILKGRAKQVIEKYESMLAGCAPKERKRLLLLRREFEQQRRDAAPGFIYPDEIDSNNG